MTAIEKPMLFSAPMVRALLDGSKTQTRRAVKFPKWIERGNAINEATPVSTCRAVEQYPNGWFFVCDDEGGGVKLNAPHPVGSLVWVKETFKFVPVGRHCVYRADEPKTKSQEVDHAFGPWKPSIFMPRAASRITLEITGVKVERLQDISEDDAKAEGVTVKVDAGIASQLCKGNPGPAQLEYFALWEAINGKGSWALNPWVWTYTFKRIKP